MNLMERLKDDWQTKTLLLIGGIHVGLYWSHFLTEHL